MKNVLREIHRRSLWQVLGIYLAASWIVLQIVETLGGTIGLPEWFGAVAFGLLLVGLPVVLATAYPQGGVRGRAAPAVTPFAAPERPAAQAPAVADSSGATCEPLCR